MPGDQAERQENDNSREFRAASREELSPGFDMRV